MMAALTDDPADLTQPERVGRFPLRLTGSRRRRRRPDPSPRAGPGSGAERRSRWSESGQPRLPPDSDSFGVACRAQQLVTSEVSFRVRVTITVTGKFIPGPRVTDGHLRVPVRLGVGLAPGQWYRGLKA